MRVSDPTSVIIGRVRTMTAPDGLAEAVAWRGERIVAVGDADEVLAQAGPDAEVRRVDGCVMPAFIDPHVHLDTSRPDRPYDRATTPGELIALLTERAAHMPAGEFLRAEGALDGRLPSREELDAAFPTRPVFITSTFTGIANTAALVACGIDAATPTPQGGYIGRGPDGTPNGAIGDLAIRLIDRHVPPPGDTFEQRLALGSMRLRRAGVGTVHQIVNYPEVVHALNSLRRESRLPTRFGLLYKAYGHVTSSSSLTNLGVETGFGDDWIRVQGIKFLFDGGYPDGALRYTDDLEAGPSVIRTPVETLSDLMSDAHRSMLRCAVHTNGDRALDTVLDVFERILSEHPREDHRHRLEHAGNAPLTEAQMRRIRRLGLVAVPNPPLLFRKLSSLRREPGAEAGAPIDLRRLIDAGVPVAVGSDYPDMYPGDPLTNIQELVSRDFSGPAAERITRWEAFSLYTRTGAWLGFEEGLKGRLVPGCLADLVVLSEDPLSSDVGLESVEVLDTIVGGTGTGSVETAAR